MFKKGECPKWPWTGSRCIAEWFSLMFLLAYHNAQEHALTLYWEQLFLFAQCARYTTPQRHNAMTVLTRMRCGLQLFRSFILPLRY